MTLAGYLSPYRIIDRILPYSPLVQARRFLAPSQEAERPLSPDLQAQRDVSSPDHQRLQRILQRLISQGLNGLGLSGSGRAIQFQAHLIHSNELNAGQMYGQIIVHQGLIRYFEQHEQAALVRAPGGMVDEAMLNERVDSLLASVMAHEMVHGLESHATQLRACRFTGLLGVLVFGPVGYQVLKGCVRLRWLTTALAVLAFHIGRQELPQHGGPGGSRALLRRSLASLALAGALGAFGLVAPRFYSALLSLLLAMAVDQAVHAVMSRTLELEADRGALELIRGAGYNPDSLARALELDALMPDESRTRGDRVFASHPSSSDRLAAVRALLARSQNQPDRLAS
jgi:predicted Zn-dependent protease